MADQRRRYERFQTELPVRLFIPDPDSDDLRFEAYLHTRNLGLGGVFVESTFLLKTSIELWLDLELPNATLTIRGRIVHAVDLDDRTFTSGMGIEFLDMESEGREILMRDFAPPRYQSFYQSMLGELPHLEEQFQMEDISLVLNLWEEWKIVQEGGPLATESGAPEPTQRRK